jgi:hypothetical protein
MRVDEIADCLHARPARGRMFEQPPCGFRKMIGLAVSDSEQEYQHIVRQILHGVLSR